MDNVLSTILLDKHHLTVGETVTLFCHGLTTTATDWIGLFYSGDVESVSNCLDYKQGGGSVGRRGLKWLIANSINFEEAENECLFKYINGASGSVKAISKVVHIIRTDLQEISSPSGTLNSLFSGQLLEFTITGMEARNLKRTFFGRPSPYVKVSIRPGRMQRKAWRSHHGPIGKTSCQVNTTEPSWSNEVFAFKASIWDILEIEVRNRSTGIKPTFSRFLGKLHFPLRELLTKGRSRTQTFNGQLMKREPSRKILGTFSLTIKTDRDLPGSRNSRRQASPDSLESGDVNGELVNETGEERPESDENRRPSLNASTPDDDLSFRDRTSTVPIPPVRAIAQVYMDQSTTAQSQPDLLGIPYTTHENVQLRKRALNNALSISPELTNRLNSRLSMPPFVFSSTSLRSFENSPSTSSSFANDMALRADGNEEDTTCENSSTHDETDDTSLSEPVNRNLNNEMEALSISLESSTRSSPSETISETTLNVTSLVLPSSETGDNQSSSSIANSELGENDVCEENAANRQGTSINSDRVTNEVDNQNTCDLRDVGVNNLSLDNCSEQNSQTTTNEQETNAGTSVNAALQQVHEPVANDEVLNNKDINEVNEAEEPSSELTVDNTGTDLQDGTMELVSPSPLESSLVADDSSPAQDSSVSVDNLPSSTNSLSLTVQPTLQDEILTVEQPIQEPGNSLGDGDFATLEGLPVNDGDEGTHLDSLPEDDNGETGSTNQRNSPVVNNPCALSVVMNEDSSEFSSTPNTGQIEAPDENQVIQNSVPHNNSILTRFVGDLNGDAFMDLVSEPDIMNVLSLSNATSSDIVMPTQSTDIEGTSPRRTMGNCNLRTLFQVPDNESSVATHMIDSSVERLQQDGTNEDVNADIVSENSDRIISNLSNHDSSASNGSNDYVGTSDLSTHGSSNISDVSPSNSTPVVENSSSSDGLLPGDNSELDGTELVDNTSGIDQHGVEQTNTEDMLSQSARTENSASATTVNVTLMSQSSSNDESTSQRPTLPSPVPSITHVRYLRSKNVSIRLPSRTASPLPVVYVVPPNVPVSRGLHGDDDDDLLSSLIEADPVLPATRLETPANSNREPRTGISLARDVFDAPDGSRDIINDGASTSRSGTSLSEATAEVRRSSASAVSHSASKRRSSSESSQSGSAKNKKKNKSRSRTSRQSSITERTEGPEPSSGQTRSRRRTSEETTNRNLTDNTTSADNTNLTDNSMEEANDESSSSHRPDSIYVQISDFASDEDARDEPLPPHWERAVDSYGRVYYIDHENRSTTWTRPSAASASETSLNEVNHHRQNLDRRYQSFRRTLSGRRRRRSYDEAANASVDVAISTETSSSSDTSTTTTPAVTRSTPDTNTPSPSARASASRSNELTPSRPSGDNRLLLNSTFVKFLTRPDFITFLRSSGPNGQYYFSHPEVKDMVKRIKEDPRNYLRFMHDRSLVTFLNGFADTSQPLPRGWEQKTDQYGQKYFVDHNSRSTNFADPRLPVDTTMARNRSRATLETAYADRSRRPPPPGMQQRATAVNTPSSSGQRSQEQRRSERLTYNQQIVEFLRQPNVDDVLAAKDPSYANNVALKCSVDKIRRDGQRALRLLSDNVDLIVLLSLFEDDIVSWIPDSKQQKPAVQDKKRNMYNGHDDQGPSSRKTSKPAPYKRDFQAKVKSFHKNIIHKGLGQGPDKIQLNIRREHILEDAFDELMKQNPKTLQKGKLEVKFSGEEGLDYGGPQREFFFLLSRQLFNPYYGLFEYSAQDTYTLHISAMSSFVDNAHDWYRFSGRIIALVIIHQHLLDAFFTRPFYKLLLKSSCDLRDVEALDALFHQSLAWIMETDITDFSLDLSFTVNEELCGQVNERELLPGGKDIRVTEDNKLGYVELMSNWRIDRGVSDQRKSILKGFYEIIDYDLVSMFDACELELLISGTADIDVSDWFSHTEYRSGYHPNHKVIRWFWQAVKSFDNEQRLRLLQFVTGTSSVPYEGFAALRGSTGLRKFCIEKWGNHTMLPRAHTCFNRLDLPSYQNYNELLEKLTLAVEETSTFGIQ